MRSVCVRLSVCIVRSSCVCLGALFSLCIPVQLYPVQSLSCYYPPHNDLFDVRININTRRLSAGKNVTSSPLIPLLFFSLFFLFKATYPYLYFTYTVHKLKDQVKTKCLFYLKGVFSLPFQVTFRRNARDYFSHFAAQWRPFTVLTTYITLVALQCRSFYIGSGASPFTV